ncbi:MAG: transporter [Clostridium sp.]|nr:transporter [Clostridium sp.]MDY3828442.1 transporter [Clostridium sp.]
MKSEKNKVFQIAVVFIGTIVGAGLASGKEITTFFTSYGIKSFLGIIFCGIFYIIISSIISKISIMYKLNSYSEVINVISPNILGKITGIITTLYLISSASIILAGSGALINQFFHIPKIFGTLFMLILAIIFLLRETDGLIEVNSFIVPILFFVILTLLILYAIFFSDSFTLKNISLPKSNNSLIISTILYAGYNTLCSSGVIVPLSTKMNNLKTMILGITFGSIFLTIICFIINYLLLINTPYIYDYEIPLLFVSTRFGSLIQGVILVIILLEMFSTEVSDVYSISKTLKQSFSIDFKKGIFIVLAFALPISQIGFTNLISTLYPFFGLLSLIFIVQCIIFYIKHKNKI